jgi:hypothetical protein
MVRLLVKFEEERQFNMCDKYMSQKKLRIRENSDEGPGH